MSDVNPGLTRRRPKKFRSEKEKRFYYDTWKASGLSKHEFCQQHDLPEGTFYAWCHHFDKEVLSTDGALLPNPILGPESQNSGATITCRHSQFRHPIQNSAT